MEGTVLKVENLDAYFGSNHILKNINMEIPANKVIAMMGPSGCGKTTFIRCINRMHELNPDARAEGEQVERLYNALVAAKKKSGESVSGTLDSFSQFVQNKTSQIRKQYGCHSVEYSVELHDGQVKLKAKAKT